MERYQYEPLQDQGQDIRLITLLPGEFDDQIRVQIRHVPLLAKEIAKMPTILTGWNVYETRERRIIFWGPDRNKSWDHPDPDFSPELYGDRQDREVASVDFAALSYEWGPEQNMEDIHVLAADGSTTRGKLKSSFNRLRLSGKTKGLKKAGFTSRLPVRQNIAIALRHIRHTTTRSHFWVDAISINQDDTSERSRQVSRMQEIYSLAPRVIVWLGESSSTSTAALSTLEYLGGQCLLYYLIRHPEARERDRWDPRTPLPYDIQTWNAISELYGRSYFNRLWIWQEIVLADDRAVVYCGGEKLDWPTFRRAVVRTFQQQSNMPEQLRRRFQHVNALAMFGTDYALDSYMYETRNQQCADPRDRIYAIRGLLDRGLANRITPDYGRTVADVYKDAVLAFLEIDGFLDLVNQCDIGSRAIVRLPSHHPPYKLELLGVRCATLEHVGAQAIDPECVGKTLKMMRDWFPEDLCDARYIIGESLVDVHATILCGNVLADAFVRNEGYITRADARKSYLAYISPKDDGSEESNREIADDRYVQSILGRSWGSVLLKTREGYVGTGPPSAKQGDVVCVLLGSSLPLLLRTALPKDFQVVGAVYMHGLMQGEAFLGYLPSP
ncbi:HET-domain-containing protein [Lophiostoma macrostomum CBS 122681]|uniref:HET-domain-containing protein n=1 Tax=Lophiostoma macrostomum CBS 122681 TaxID=1314788 RepID=A0A6A6SQD8_9PLEO|nr:HET-domain-containing protein [Lophiostoma macrostomum CBS 122681]